MGTVVDTSGPGPTTSSRSAAPDVVDDHVDHGDHGSVDHDLVEHSAEDHEDYGDEHYDDEPVEDADVEAAQMTEPPHASAEAREDAGVEPAVVARHEPRFGPGPSAPTRAELRVDFGAHLEANYRRLVAQLYAITLDPAEAHAIVQDAYSRAWRSWGLISRSPDPTGWVRRVAVRSTVRSWRRWRWGTRRPINAPGPDTPTGALLATLALLAAAERRCVVLHHMAGSSVREIAAVEGVSVGTTVARLNRAQQIVSDGMAALLSNGMPDALGTHNGWAAPEWDGPSSAAPGADDDEEGLR